MRRALRLTLIAYASLLVAPVATVASTPTWPSFAVGVAVGALVALPVSDRIDDPSQLSSLSRILAGFVLPLGWLWPAAKGATSIPTFFFTPWFVGALAAIVWLAAVVVASEWRTRERLGQLTERVAFTARSPPEQRRQLRIAAGTLLVLVVGYVVASVAFGFGGESWSSLWTVAGTLPAWITVFADSDGREVAVTDEGLRIERSVHDWETFDGYEVTEESLTLSRSAWYRSSLSFDRADVEDIEAVTAALDDSLQYT